MGAKNMDLTWEEKLQIFQKLRREAINNACEEFMLIYRRLQNKNSLVKIIPENN